MQTIDDDGGEEGHEERREERTTKRGSNYARYSHVSVARASSTRVRSLINNTINARRDRRARWAIPFESESPFSRVDLHCRRI